MDESKSEDSDTAAERILPSPSSYAGVILGLSESSANALDQQSTQASNAIIVPANSNCDHHDIMMQPTPSHATSPAAKSSFKIISPPIILTVPHRYSRRLAAKAEQAGGRRGGA